MINGGGLFLLVVAVGRGVRVASGATVTCGVHPSRASRMMHRIVVSVSERNTDIGMEMWLSGVGLWLVLGRLYIKCKSLRLGGRSLALATLALAFLADQVSRCQSPGEQARKTHGEDERSSHGAGQS